jgi:hypothetical protein
MVFMPHPLLTRQLHPSSQVSSALGKRRHKIYENKFRRPDTSMDGSMSLDWILT